MIVSLSNDNTEKFDTISNTTTTIQAPSTVRRVADLEGRGGVDEEKSPAKL